jgi:N-acetylglucosaminyldiphosphoundecaprenol N-acetyl-beta-D-mannosaminyltransferase
VRIDAVPPDLAADLLLESSYGAARAVHLCNAYTLSLALRDPAYRDVLNADDLNLADGHPVAAVGRRRGHSQMTSRVYGPDLMLAVLDRGRQRGLRHYLFGGTPQVLAALQASLTGRFPGLQVVGAESAPFRPLGDQDLALVRERVAAARPDIVWVGLGTPRQDVFAHENAAALGCTVVAIGAAFDFHAGAKRQAPGWMQKRGLEWLFRLATEPRRLWRRYLVGNTLFVLGVMRDAVAGRRPS